jgi:hypothetical protein
MMQEYTVMEVYNELAYRVDALKKRDEQDEITRALIYELNWVRSILELTPEINPPKTK